MIDLITNIRQNASVVDGNSPYVGEGVTSALEVPAMVLLQLADTALLGLHPAVRQRRRRSFLAGLPRRRRRADRARATLTRFIGLPSRRGYTYLH